MADTANTIASKLTGESTEVEDTGTSEIDESTEVTVEVDTDTDEGQEVEDTEESEEVKEDDLPDPIKEILSKNRKLVRDAEKRAKAAEKALAEKDGVAPEASDTKFRDLYVTRSATTALSEAGLTSGTERFLKMIDLSEVDVDEDGEISGLDTQIEALKADYPELFGKKEVVKKPAVKADAAGRRQTVTAPSTSASKISDRLLGK